MTRIETVIVNAVHRNWIFVKVLTDQPGLYGWGEATLEWKTRAVKGAIDDLAPFGAVALNFDVAITNFVIREEAVGIVPWFDGICSVHPLQLKDHSWMVPEAPGLGIEIDEVAATKHPFEHEIISATNSVLADGRIANW